jgi:hypothetical protein
VLRGGSVGTNGDIVGEAPLERRDEPAEDKVPKGTNIWIGILQKRSIRLWEGWEEEHEKWGGSFPRHVWVCS